MPRWRLGKLGDKRAIETLGADPAYRLAADAAGDCTAAICLLGINCESHENFLSESLEVRREDHGVPGTPPRRGLRTRARSASPAARKPRNACSTVGIPSSDPTRAPVALALATIALPVIRRSW